MKNTETEVYSSNIGFQPFYLLWPWGFPEEQGPDQSEQLGWKIGDRFFNVLWLILCIIITDYILFYDYYMLIVAVLLLWLILIIFIIIIKNGKNNIANNNNNINNDDKNT